MYSNLTSVRPSGWLAGSSRRRGGEATTPVNLASGCAATKILLPRRMLVSKFKFGVVGIFPACATVAFMERSCEGRQQTRSRHDNAKIKRTLVHLESIAMDVVINKFLLRFFRRQGKER